MQDWSHFRANADPVLSGNHLFFCGKLSLFFIVTCFMAGKSLMISFVHECFGMIETLNVS